MPEGAWEGDDLGCWPAAKILLAANRFGLFPGRFTSQPSTCQRRPGDHSDLLILAELAESDIFVALTGKLVPDIIAGGEELLIEGEIDGGQRLIKLLNFARAHDG